MPIDIYDGVTLKQKAFVIEECIFRNCTLVECSLYYSGGVFEWVNTNFQNCNWGFRGAARDTMQLLATLGIVKAGAPQPISMQSATGKMN